MTTGQRTYLGSLKNGIQSISYNSSYPASISLTIPQTCKNCGGWTAISTSVIVIATLALPFLNPSKKAYFLIVAFWTFVYWYFFSIDGSRKDSVGLAAFIPYAATIYTLFTLVFEDILPTPGEFPIEYGILYFGGLSLGLYFDIISNYLPSLLSLSFSSQMFRNGAGATTFLICIFVVISLCGAYFVVFHRRGHTLQNIIGGYLLVIPVYALLPIVLGGLLLHVHHYIAAIFLIPITRMETRAAMFVSAVLLGWFSQGVIVYGFASPFDTPSSAAASLGITSGSRSVVWTLNQTRISQGMVDWNYPYNSTVNLTDISQTSTQQLGPNFQIGAYSLSMNDVEVYRGVQSSFNASLIATTGPNYFRVAPVFQGGLLDFSGVALIDFNAQTFYLFAQFQN